MSKTGWMERIAEQDSREEARDVFNEWLEMKASVNDAVEFVERTGDVGVLHVRTGPPQTPNADTQTARDIIQRYARGRCPVRCIDVTGVSEGVVQLNMLLADLRVSDPRSE